MTNSRNRSTQLDFRKVRSRAALLGMGSLHIFERRYDNAHNLGVTTATAPSLAWHGKTMDRNQANKVAEFLGLDDYAQLEAGQPISYWNQFIETHRDQDVVFKLRLDGDSDWRNGDFGELFQAEIDKFPKVDINAMWQLILIGEPGDQFMAILESDQSFCQIAPIDHSACQATIASKAQTMVYPSDCKIGFDKSKGTGWRRFVVVRANEIMLAAKNYQNINRPISLQDLDAFAAHLLQQKDQDIAVDTYEFVLFAPEST